MGLNILEIVMGNKKVSMATVISVSVALMIVAAFFVLHVPAVH